ncbi:MAG: hypothetical protein K0Q81_1930, partial [Paenibacillus sp.]|nr:hypothetical protein [Paenibacillus sp.]
MKRRLQIGMWNGLNREYWETYANER